MRLFAIRDTETNTLVPERYFLKKPEAKRERDRLNAEHNAPMRFVVTPGPDNQNRTSPAKGAQRA